MEQRRLSMILKKEQEKEYVGDILRFHMGLSSALIKRIKWLEDGILLDGQKVITRSYGKEGQCLSALIGETGKKSPFVPRYGELDIVYQDQDFLMINKEAGVVVHPTPNHWDDTMGNFLLYYYEKIGFQGDFHPVHRLDRGTSGLIVVAKHPYAQEQFTKQLHSPVFRREYMAICWGKLNPDSGTINAPIIQKEKMLRAVDSKGLEAITHYETISTGSLEGKPVSLVALSLGTGRTHQIRVHLTHKGHPLLGDELYGQGDYLNHTALHAFRLSLQQPVEKTPLSFTAKPPEDFCALVEQANLSLPDWFT